ncbi:MAG TPA: TVP38/TMEM64 family protein [Ruminiclostridium sp.]
MINKNIKKLLIVTGALIFILILEYVFIYHFEDIKKINLKMMEDYIKSYGSWSIAVFLVISTIRPIAVIIPITIITLIAGSLYGPVYGFILAMISIIISSNVAFLISRYLGKSFIEKLVKKKADKINLRVEKSGFKIIFFMRISGVFPLDILSYTAGLTKVRYRDFMLATILGSMLETFSVANMGHNIKNPLSPGFILSVALVLITVGIPLIYNKFHKQSS